MGLNDVDGVGESSSSSSRSSSTSSKPEPEFEKVIGSEPFKKSFNKEQWQKVKRVIRSEMDYSVQEVLNNLPAEKRYETLHQAVTWDEGNLTEAQEELKTDDRCVVCGKANSQSTTTVAGEEVHIHHTVGQLAKELGEEWRGQDE